MTIIEIAENPNCAATERVFHDLDAPRPVRRVRLLHAAGTPQWHAVTGWTVAGVPCPALMTKVDDSGDGVALLVFGGDAGLRLRPEGSEAPWTIDDTRQWGEPLLILGDPADVE